MWFRLFLVAEIGSNKKVSSGVTTDGVKSGRFDMKHHFREASIVENAWALEIGGFPVVWCKFQQLRLKKERMFRQLRLGKNKYFGNESRKEEWKNFLNQTSSYTMWNFILD